MRAMGPRLRGSDGFEVGGANSTNNVRAMHTNRTTTKQLPPRHSASLRDRYA
jgi:hypothetical protein